MAITTKKCAHCGKSFVGTARAKFCQDQCRVYAFRGQPKPSAKRAGSTRKPAAPAQPAAAPSVASRIAQLDPKNL